MSFIDKLKQDSQEYGISIWRLPDVVLLLMAFTNASVMVFTYFWASKLAEDPYQTVILVAFESVVILIFGNILVESSRRLLETSKLKKEFVRIVSHQMRTPLTTMRWFLDILLNMLRRECEDLKNERCLVSAQKKQKVVEKINAENEKMRTMVEEMLTVSRIDQFATKDSIKVDFKKIVLDCEKNLLSYAGTKNIKVSNDFPEYECSAILNESDLKIIVINLLENAIKYAFSDTEIFIQLTKNNSEGVELFFVNKGIEIKEEEKDFIFQQFYRGAEARKMQPEGTGFGLFIVKQLVEKNQGKIFLETRPQENEIKFKVVF